MQYFPWINSTCGAYAENVGFYQQVSSVNGNSTSDSSSYYNSPLFPLPTSLVFLNTEVIKQTIFGHEAIFRNQVMELHRLYDKQRELMRLASSEFGLMEQKQSSVSWLSPCYVSQSVAHAKHFQLEVGKILYTDRGTHQIECTSRHCELLDASRFKKYNNKVLDLQLPPSEYMDEDDIGFSGISKATHLVRNTSSSLALNDDVGQQPSGWDVQEKGSRAESSRPILLDLNERFNFEEPMPSTRHDELLFKDLSRSTTQLVDCSAPGDADKLVHHDNVAGHKTSDSNLRNQELNPNGFSISAGFPSLMSGGWDSDSHSGTDHGMKRSSKKRTLNSSRAQGCLTISENTTQDTLIRVPKSPQLIPVSDKTKTHSKHVSSPMQSVFDVRQNPSVVQALPCTHALVRMKNKKFKPLLTATRPDRDNPHSKKGRMNPMVDRVKNSWKIKRRRRDLGDGKVSQVSYGLEPLCPENEECSPPRGESDENILDMSCLFYAADDGDVETDVARIAAKAVLLLSATDARLNSSSFSESSLVSPDNPLHWFAEVVSFESRKESIFQNFDDFESMTLKLVDTNTEEQYCHSITASQDEKLTLVTTVSARATRAACGKRSKKLMDFQGVVLPSISSLSKYEVTEDLQLIECLTEAKTPGSFDSQKRNGFSRGRRQSSNSVSTAVENSPYSPLDLQNKTSIEYHAHERRPMMIDWGKINRRRRGQRYPARKLTFIQVAHTLKAH